jgi:hypothetical protein
MIRKLDQREAIIKANGREFKFIAADGAIYTNDKIKTMTDTERNDETNMARRDCFLTAVSSLAAGDAAGL